MLTKENEISDELYQYYSAQLKALSIDMSNLHDIQIETEYIESMNKLAMLNEKIETTSVIEIKKYISMLKRKESSGFDAVSDFMIKRMSPGYISCLANCFNVWLSEYRYPDVWKVAKIVTLNKLKARVPRSPYLFIVYHCDLVTCIGAHSSHIFADDLNILITPPICRGIKPMIKFLEEEGTRVCNEIANYSKKWKQPINLSKSVVQVFHLQVQNPVVNVYMKSQRLQLIKEFKY